MTDLTTQLLYILGGGVFISILASVWFVVGDLNEKSRGEKTHSCGMGCSGCPSASSCHRDDKLPM